MDLVLRAPRFPRPGETLHAGDLRIFPGGKGANQALAAARLAAGVSMIGFVGTDEYGRNLVAHLQSAGVDCARIGKSDRATGVAMIVVLESGENSILISPGANNMATPAMVIPKLSDISPGDYLLCQLEIPIETSIAALRLARERGAQSMLDPAPAQKLTREALALAGLITPNQSEAAALIGDGAPPPKSHADGIQACRKLLEIGARMVVLKMGALGSVFADEAETIVACGFEVPVVDTTAAGDTFNAALATMLVAGEPAGPALEFANAAAALSVTVEGAQTSAPFTGDVRRFLAEHKSLTTRVEVRR